MSFDLDAHWLESGESTPEIRATSAQLTVRINQHVVTRAEDLFAKTVNDSVRVAAYPMAFWLASNWWRLRWESTPEFAKLMPTDWRMSHELPAIGYGYVWPQAELTSDGHTITVRVQPGRRRENEPLRYLERFVEECPAHEFELGLERFISLVLSRLADCALPETELKQLWTQIRDERADATLAEQRRVEARLGLDPDDAPDIVRKFVAFAQTSGKAALEEMAAAHTGEDRNAYYAQIAGLTQLGGHEGAFQIQLPPAPAVASAPWTRGREVARLVRAQLGLNGSPVSNQHLADALGVVAGIFENTQVQRRGPAVAIPRPNEKVRFVLQKTVTSGRRFEGARLLGDHLLATEVGGWSVATDAKTWRQRAQRAFAAELLAPIDGIRARLEHDLQDERIEKVAAEFNVSPFLIQSQLANNGLLDPSLVGAGAH